MSAVRGRGSTGPGGARMEAGSGRERLRFRYGKDDRLAYLGHLEVINTIMRSVRRADLPFSIGNGFARRMRIQFSQALPVGASSSCEYFDLELVRRMEAEVALSKLAAATPALLSPVCAGYIDCPQPALEAWLDRAAWDVEVGAPGMEASALEAGIDEVRSLGTLTYQRGDKIKRVDLNACLVGFEVVPSSSGVLVHLETKSTAAASLRPRILVDAAIRAAGLVGCDTIRVRRVGQWHAEDGRLVEPL